MPGNPTRILEGIKKLEALKDQPKNVRFKVSKGKVSLNERKDGLRAVGEKVQSGRAVLEERKGQLAMSQKIQAGKASLDTRKAQMALDKRIQAGKVGLEVAKAQMKTASRQVELEPDYARRAIVGGAAGGLGGGGVGALGGFASQGVKGILPGAIGGGLMGVPAGVALGLPGLRIQKKKGTGPLSLMRATEGPRKGKLILGREGEMKTASLLWGGAKQREFSAQLEKDTQRVGEMPDAERKAHIKAIRKKNLQGLKNWVLGSKEKKASIPGQDLRGAKGLQLPTDDSKVFANSNLNKSQTAAEVGPAPSLGQLKPKGPTIQSQATRGISTRGGLPKMASLTGETMANIQNDPLVQYLQKHAQELEDNLDNMPKQKSEEPLADEPGCPSGSHIEAQSKKQRKDVLDEMFDNAHKPPRLVSS